MNQRPLLTSDTQKQTHGASRTWMGIIVTRHDERTSHYLLISASFISSFTDSPEDVTTGWVKWSDMARRSNESPCRNTQRYGGRQWNTAPLKLFFETKHYSRMCFYTFFPLCTIHRDIKTNSWYILGEISGPQGGEHKDHCLLGYCTLYYGKNWPAFQRCLLPLWSS